MKLALFIIICSGLYNQCMPPVDTNNTYENHYNCMIGGYKESLSLMEELDKNQANFNKTYIKFFCKEVTKIEENT